MHALGRWIRQQLDARGWTRADLVRHQPGLTHQTISRLVKDDREYLDQTPHRRTLQLLADAFGTSLDTVLLLAAESIGVPVGGLTVTGLTTATNEELLAELAVRLRAGQHLAPTPDVVTQPEPGVRWIGEVKHAGSLKSGRKQPGQRVTRAARKAPSSTDGDRL